eukprot:m.138491 g.138491  ORF g.138491 m.138491 type:complete len:78 (+) comp9600_c1_seq5:96-329(+)
MKSPPTPPTMTLTPDPAEPAVKPAKRALPRPPPGARVLPQPPSGAPAAARRPRTTSVRHCNVALSADCIRLHVMAAL